MKTNITKRIYLIPLILLSIVLFGCHSIVLYESLDSHCYYNIFIKHHYIKTNGTKCVSMKVNIVASSSKSDSLTIFRNDMCYMKMKLIYDNEVYVSTSISMSLSNVIPYYWATFDFGKGIEFDPRNDDHEIELIFTDKDSVAYTYKFKNE